MAPSVNGMLALVQTVHLALNIYCKEHAQWADICVLNI